MACRVCCLAAAASGGGERAARGCRASTEAVGAPCEVNYEPGQPRNCMRCAPTPTNKGSESARLHRKFSYRTPGATPRVFNPSLLRLGAAAGLRPAQRRAAPCALLASPRHALLVAGALRDASQRFLHRSALPRRRGRTWTCAPRDPPGHFERARPPFKNPPRTAARSDAQRSRAEF